MSLDVDPVSIRGTWWRHIPAGGDAYRVPADPADNRWQRGEVVDALYLADTRETAWAEFLRFLAEAGLSPRVMLPRDLWQWNVHLPRVADLRTEGALVRVGLRLPRPTSGEWPLFQAVGEQLYREGWAGLVAPSAARPDDAAVLCVFREAERIAGADPMPPPERIDDIPVIPRGLTT